MKRLWSSLDFPDDSVVKNLPANAGERSSIPEWGGYPGEGNGNPLQNICLKNFHGQRSLVGYSPWSWTRLSWTWLRTCQQQSSLTYCIPENESESHSVMSYALQSHGLCSPWNSPGQNTEWVAFPFSRGSSQHRGWTQAFHTAGRFFTSWATREAQEYWSG